MADVEITYKMTPTEDSLKEIAEKYSNILDKQTGKRTGKPSKELTDLEKVLKSIRFVDPRTAYSQKLSVGTKAIGAEDKGIGVIAGATLGILAAVTIISAFFEAVGPIIKVVMKILTFILLILLMPFLKIFLTLLGPMAKFFIQMAKGISDLTDFLLTPQKAGANVIAGAFDLGSWALENLNKTLTSFDLGKWAKDTLDGLITTAFNVAKWLEDNFKNFFNPVTYDLTDWITNALLGPMGVIVKTGLETLAATKFGDSINYFIAKLIQLLVETINGVIKMIKSIKIPVFQGIKWGNVLGFKIPVGINWGESSPFSGIQELSAPANVTSAISTYENAAKQNASSSAQINNYQYFTFEGNVGTNEFFKKAAEQIARIQAQNKSTKTSYFSGNTGG